eukprot:1161697-Pelagomonas_calceolata.AAC.2
MCGKRLRCSTPRNLERGHARPSLTRVNEKGVYKGFTMVACSPRMKKTIRKFRGEEAHCEGCMGVVTLKMHRQMSFGLRRVYTA